MMDIGGSNEPSTAETGTGEIDLPNTAGDNNLTFSWSVGNLGRKLR